MLLEQASSLANRGRNADAMALCEHYLRLQGPSAAAHSLMGVIHQAAGYRRRGGECFHKAVYLDPGHDEALLAWHSSPSVAATRPPPRRSAAAPSGPS